MRELRRRAEAEGSILRIAFLGTPEVAVAAAASLVDAGHDVVLVVTRADKRRGRARAAGPSPVKTAALELGLPSPIGPTRSSIRRRAGCRRGLRQDHQAASAGALPMVNVHFSLLPRWRGAAPVERAILAGDVRPACASWSWRRAWIPGRCWGGGSFHRAR